MPSTAAVASSTPASPAASSPASAAAGAVKLTLAPESSQVQIRMRELLAGNTIQNDAVESSKAVSGSLTINPDGSVAARSTISLDLRTLQSDRATRDRFIKGRAVLDTGSTPNAEVTVTQLQGLEGPLPTTGQKTFKMVSDATVHGVTKPLTWNVKATFGPQDVKGEAAADFTLSEFGLNVPQVGPVVKVDDPGKLVVDFTAARWAA